MDNSKETSTIEPVSSSLHSRLSLLSKSQTQQPCIYKVHQHLRNVNDEAYEPQIVAIGPYHHGKDNLRMMEKHKLRYLESLLRRENQNVDLYISSIRGLEEQARSCYSEPISLDPTEFIEMLVLDGCFIIELMRKYSDQPSCENDPIIQMDWILSSLQRDLILFENQIPFFVLRKLFDLIESRDIHITLNYLIRFFSHNLYPSLEIKRIGNDVVGEEELKNRGEIKHLLDFIHNNWRPCFKNDVQIKFDDSFCIRSVLFCLKKKPPSTSGRECSFIHSATELKKANVRFSRRKFGGDDNSKRKSDDNLFWIDFKRGVLVMPQLTVDDRTECTFRNLIAYEQYFPDETDYVTDYVTFMDCLINTPRDVEILSKSKIIDNWMGDNEVVVGIFNRLTDSVSCSNKGMYSGVVDRVNKQYKRPWNHAMAVLRRDYFYSPWALVAFFSAVLLLLLTVAQTVCSLIQL